MFPKRMFPARMFPTRMFPRKGAATDATPPTVFRKTRLGVVRRPASNG